MGDTKIGKCVVCHKTIELSSSGRSALTDHAKGMKHKEALHKVKSFGEKVQLRILLPQTVKPHWMVALLSQMLQKLK